MKARLINVTLRILTLASKLILIFLLARYLPASDVGIYGLISVSIGYALYIVGLEFYLYANRQLITAKQDAYGAIFTNQFSLYIVTYIVTILALAPIITKNINLPTGLYYWLIAILFFEHWAQEFNRIFISLSKQILASQILFIRSGLWVLIITPIMMFLPSQRTIEAVLFFWLLGSISACIIGINKLNKEIPNWPKAVNWQWLKAGLYVSLPFLISTLSTRALFTIDRYWINHLTNLEVLGAYTLFIGLSMALTSFIDAAVFSFIYPALVKAKNSPDAFRKHITQLTSQTLLLITLFCLLALTSIDTALGLLENEVYYNNKWIFPWTLLASVLFTLGFVPQYGLYALEKDKYIIIIHIVGFLVFLASTYFLSESYPETAVLIGLSFSLAITTGLKATALFITVPREYLWKSQKKNVY